MKKTLFLLFVAVVASSCFHEVYPIYPEHTYSVRNSCDENILVEYSLSAKFVANYVNKKDSSNLLDTMMVASNEVREFILRTSCTFPPQLFPSEVFSSIKIVVGKDTLSYTPIQDDQWECTDIKENCDYDVVHHHWVLDVNK